MKPLKIVPYKQKNGKFALEDLTFKLPILGEGGKKLLFKTAEEALMWAEILK